ncbi:hypothetical protein GCM10010917_16270 [Paenibacillus physcomitrellae]|uniref:Uncharacterized protein n=1 Tax=Paenibacillus physcomitrellae TaxID=1619311 RepID=A0ABQ1FYU0_9BACL|nr:hypothetical protein GCM10010917_16270 [Paenibacillus physcomitrellae]
MIPLSLLMYDKLPYVRTMERGKGRSLPASVYLRPSSISPRPLIYPPTLCSLRLRIRVRSCAFQSGRRCGGCYGDFIRGDELPDHVLDNGSGGIRPS